MKEYYIPIWEKNKILADVNIITIKAASLNEAIAKVQTQNPDWEVDELSAADFNIRNWN
ncbi:hypothetical protein LCGC14_0547170 [marine sediment metagenome]|uniref:Uncharacterized protein n=1 Tax=marine sediment metagenome TaxID=412755 RepID=A0A0F9RR13_9ZZZZ